MKKYNKFFTFHFSFLLLAGFSLASCDDFFETDPDNVLNDDDYISQENEMSRGLLGIAATVQSCADNVIWMTDPRLQYLEPTGNAPVALQEIYRYEDTDGNDYADPTPYYNIIVQCNDYFYKMAEFHNRVNGAMSVSAKEDFVNMLSCALRMKMYAYYMLVSNYGEAYWWEEQVSEVSDFKDAQLYSGKQKKNNMRDLLTKCIDQLTNGIDVDGVHVDPDLTMDWNYWDNPQTLNGYVAAVLANGVPTNLGTFGYWKYMFPDAEPLLGLFYAWRASTYEGGDAASRADWLACRDVILQYMWDAETYTSDGTAPNLTDGQSGAICRFVMGAQMPLIYTSIFQYETPTVRNLCQLVFGAFYDFDNQQTNRLVQYFCPAYPDGYYLKPSDYGQSLYNESDIRCTVQRIASDKINGQEALTKFYYYFADGYLRDKITEIEPVVVLMRGADLHYLLAEAENHLGHWEVADAIFNNGFMQKFPLNVYQLYDRLHETDEYGNIVWDYRYLRFHGSDLSASTSYSAYPDAPADEKYNLTGHQGNTGLLGSIRASVYDFDPSTSTIEGMNGSESDRMKATDKIIALEYMKEMSGEGRAYGWLARTAENWDDTQMMIDLVAGNHAGYESNVTKQLTNNRFINWTLKTE